MKTLHLALKAEYFHAIQRGEKTEEYRLCNAFWQTRIGGKSFDQIKLTLGYPKSTATAKQIILPWRGYTIKIIDHPIFGNKGVQVFAINLAPNQPLAQANHARAAIKSGVT